MSEGRGSGVGEKREQEVERAIGTGSEVSEGTGSKVSDRQKSEKQQAKHNK